MSRGGRDLDPYRAWKCNVISGNVATHAAT